MKSGEHLIWDAAMSDEHRYTKAVLERGLKVTLTFVDRATAGFERMGESVAAAARAMKRLSDEQQGHQADLRKFASEHGTVPVRDRR